MKKSKSDSSTEKRFNISSKNTGLVLLSCYIPLLFDRLELTKDGQFLSSQAKLDATHFLHFLVTGFANKEETIMPLNNLLCGIDLADKIPLEINIVDADKEMMERLIEAALVSWTKLGQISINGFREAWLVRDGALTELEDKWTLKVEERGYDILIDYIPFSFSIINYPWMAKPLHVIWRN